MSNGWQKFSSVRQCIFLALLRMIAATAVTASTLNLRGISPQDLSHYDSGPFIWCKDGTKVFSTERLNDDFCDCADGTDEPGTSACANGRFHCGNQKNTPLWVFSSRVNDGICDCCDGSDEYDGRVQCNSVCAIEDDMGFTQRITIDTDKEFPLRDRIKFEDTREDLKASTSDSYLLQMIEVLEILLVIFALWHLYCWIFHRGSGTRRRISR
ncbi:hypothetical protein KP509_31G021800 [Ceratopteris richardii]|uniref:Glucosidase II beta subunit N-terminal domain-containing protein n=1 Tax=Ceratopteris richardii TaxID=49495 RepID=A0A8T2QXZ6_CERRI|nr:hypothetical protein KP509_31G021800 [Ceratopteris richardii]